MEVLIHPKAAAFLRKLNPNLKRRIKERLLGLAKHPEAGKHLKYCGFWSLRIGDYRAIYEINKKTNVIVVLFIGHIKHVYDDFSKLF